jgi:glutamate--cysteine ligase catalytic subunit
MLGVDGYYKNHEIDINTMDEDIQKMQEGIEYNPFSKSQFTHDIIVNPHPRFGTLSRNIRKRRGSKVCIKIPIFIDEKTDISEREEEPFPGYIYMDSMAFGMGQCCFQITLGTCSLKNCTYMYDQLLPFASLLVLNN